MSNNVTDPSGNVFATQNNGVANYPFGAICIVNADTSITNINAANPLPVNGTLTVNAGTNLNTSALALESGGKLASIDTKTPALGQALAAASVPVVLTAAQLTTLTPPTTVNVGNFPGTQAVTGTFWQATQPVSGTVTANAGTNLNTSALALESGGKLASIDTKTPALGQALAAASVPVVLTAAQITTLTPPTTVTANAGTNLNTSALALESGGNLATVVTNTANGTACTGVSLPTGGVGRFGWLSAIYSAIVAALPAGTNVIGKVGIDQTTPGTTNGVQLPVNQVLGGGGTAKIQASNAVGSVSTIVSTELNSLANNSQVVSSVAGSSGVITVPTQTQMRVELFVTFGTAPTANTSVLVWFLQTIDGGTSYEDGSSTVTPTRNPDVIFTVNAITTGQRLQKVVDTPTGNFKVLVKNNGTAQAFSSTLNTVRILPYTRQQQ